MKTKICTILLFLTVLTCLTVTALSAQTILSPGDIKIIKIGLGDAGPAAPPACLWDSFIFKNMVPLEPGTEIYFTDCGVRSDGTFRPDVMGVGDGEGHIKYTVPTIVYSSYIPFLVYRTNQDSCWQSISGHFWQYTTAPRGDQIICYQMIAGNPVFITAVNYYGTGWQAEATDINESTLPPGLTEGVTALALDRTLFTGAIAFFDDPVAPPAPITPTDFACLRTIHRGVWPPSIPPTGGGGTWVWNDVSSFWATWWSSIYNSVYWRDILDATNTYDITILPVIRPAPLPYPWTVNPVELEYVSYSDWDVITCPVELSSFTAVPMSEQYVELNWVTQSETEVSGYYLLRSADEILSNTTLVSPLIPATNTSQEVSYRYQDADVEAGTWYYWLENLNMDGSMEYHGPISVTLSDDDEPDIPVVPILTNLGRGFPNPFNTSTSVSYELSKSGIIRMDVFNLKGEKIATIESGQKDSGKYSATWDGMDDNNRECSAGIYFIKLVADDYLATRKVMLIK